ncbi:hypothetical protein U3516DRAFT_830669 [Neocallimastix sp. 'constans']
MKTKTKKKGKKKTIDNNSIPIQRSSSTLIIDDSPYDNSFGQSDDSSLLTEIMDPLKSKENSLNIDTSLRDTLKIIFNDDSDHEFVSYIKTTKKKEPISVNSTKINGKLRKKSIFKSEIKDDLNTNKIQDGGFINDLLIQGNKVTMQKYYNPISLNYYASNPEISYGVGNHNNNINALINNKSLNIEVTNTQKKNNKITNNNNNNNKGLNINKTKNKNNISNINTTTTIVNSNNNNRSISRINSISSIGSNNSNIKKSKDSNYDNFNYDENEEDENDLQFEFFIPTAPITSSGYYRNYKNKNITDSVSTSLMTSYTQHTNNTIANNTSIHDNDDYELEDQNKKNNYLFDDILYDNNDNRVIDSLMRIPSAEIVVDDSIVYNESDDKYRNEYIDEYTYEYENRNENGNNNSINKKEKKNIKRKEKVNKNYNNFKKLSLIF